MQGQASKRVGSEQAQPEHVGRERELTEVGARASKERAWAGRRQGRREGARRGRAADGPRGGGAEEKEGRAHGGADSCPHSTPHTCLSGNAPTFTRSTPRWNMSDCGGGDTGSRSSSG